MLDTGLRLFQIASTLKLTKLADYAQLVFCDYLSLIRCHFDEAGVHPVQALTQGDINCYTGEIELVRDGLVARGTNEPTERLLTVLSHRCAGFSKEGTWLDKTIAGLRKDLPDFKFKYDRVVARR